MSWSITGIQGQPIEVTVVACSKLKDTEWISRQDPYVCVEYGSTKFRTRTCTDGGKNPVFQDKFVFPLIEGLRELNVLVWNSNTLTFDDFIGTGKIQLHKVLSQGFDDSSWPLQTKTGRYAGEVRLILHYAVANQKKSDSIHAPYMPPAATPQVPLYSHSVPPPAPATSYPTLPSAAPPLPTGSAPAYPPPPNAYPASSPYSSAVPPAAYPASSPYPPSSYPTSSPYPPPSYSYPPFPSYSPTSAYPPPPYQSPAAYPPGIYPPPPY